MQTQTTTSSKVNNNNQCYRCETVALRCDRESKIAVVSLNRPRYLNAINAQMWREIPVVFDALSEDEEVNAIVLTGEGKHFCAGIDVSSKESLFETLGDVENERDLGRRNEYLLRHIKRLQASVSSVERCRKPVVCMIKGACVGGGLDIAAACDIRMCDRTAFFSVKEVELGIVADIGSLQRLPSIVAPVAPRVPAQPLIQSPTIVAKTVEAKTIEGDEEATTPPIQEPTQTVEERPFSDAENEKEKRD